MSYIDPERNFKVPESKLRYLLRQAMTYEALEAGGVDNWTWYGERIHNYVRDYFDEENIDDEDLCIEDIVDKEIESFKEV